MERKSVNTNSKADWKAIDVSSMMVSIHARDGLLQVTYVNISTTLQEMTAIALDMQDGKLLCKLKNVETLSVSKLQWLPVEGTPSPGAALPFVIDGMLQMFFCVLQ